MRKGKPKILNHKIKGAKELYFFLFGIVYL